MTELIAMGVLAVCGNVLYGMLSGLAGAGLCYMLGYGRNPKFAVPAALGLNLILVGLMLMPPSAGLAFVATWFWPSLLLSAGLAWWRTRKPKD